MKQEQDYEPYGPEWEKELMKYPKAMLYRFVPPSMPQDQSAS